MPKRIIDRRYQILKRLGAGSTGEVYKVKDLRDKKIIALKILYPDRPVQRFKREFRLLAGFHHPYLCTVYDFGILDDERNYFTMEYIDGEDMYTATHGVSYETIYTWIVQLCRVLEYIHSRGLIHYDIKPGNVLIVRRAENKKHYTRSTHDVMPCVKLMDFGLAGEQRIKGGTFIKGTFPYIAPEVIKGLAVDHRADFYSLGVLLYEVFTRQPFREEKASFVTLLKQREEHMYKPFSTIVTDLPRSVERLIVRLLEFEPAARFSRANEVIKKINTLSRRRFAFETEKTIEGYLLSSRFVGRDREMAILSSLYEQARQGSGKVVLITGDAGIGKSRLLKEFKIFTQLQRSHTFIGHAYKNKTVPLEPFYSIFYELINYFNGGAELFRSRKLRLALAVLCTIFPDLVAGHLRKRVPRLVPLEPHLERLRNFEALTELIGYCAVHFGELVILLEDLHWADDLTIQFLEYLCRNLTDKHILLCGTCRQEALKGNQLLKQVINTLHDDGCFRQVELKPLTFKNLYSFLNSTITPDSNSVELVRYLLKKTGGNPFFVEEIARTLLQKRGVSIGDKISIKDVEHTLIPTAIEDIVLKRIKNLDAISCTIIKFGAVLSKGFTYDLMKQVTGLDDTKLSKALWDLERRQVVVEEDNTYRFYHATLYEALNRQMNHYERKKRHHRIGTILEIMNRKKRGRMLEDIAYHFINAKDCKKGISYGIRAAEKRSKQYAYEQAILFYRGVLTLVDRKNLKKRFILLNELARIERCFDYYDDALKHYKQASSLRTGTIKQKARIHLGIASVYLRKGQHGKALHNFSKALRMLHKMKSGISRTLLETHIHVVMSGVYLQLGQYERAQRFNPDTVRFMRNLKTTNAISMLADIYNNMGSIELHRGIYGRADYDKAIRYYNEAYTFSKKLKAQEKIATVLGNIGICYYYTYRYQKAFDYYKRAVRVSEKIGDQFGMAIKLLNIGIVLRDRGNYSEAVDYFQKALFISRKIDNPSMRGGSQLGLGASLLDVGDYRAAKEYFQKALKIFDAIGWKGEQGFLIRGIGSVYKATGDYARALKYYRKALTLFRKIEHQRKIASILVNMSSVCAETGELSKSEGHALEALTIVSGQTLLEEEVECYIVLCQLNSIKKNYTAAVDYFKKGIAIAKKIGMKRTVLRLFILLSEIYCNEKWYPKSIACAHKAIKMAHEMGTKDLYAEALLLKIKCEIAQDTLPYAEVLRMLDDVRMIAAEVGNPEILWKVYFTHGYYLHNLKQYHKASQFYKRCVDVLKSVICKFKNESLRTNYLNRPDRQAAITIMKSMKVS
jgi:serine/threonine protein kinase/tetratricopeptide (TPR) repeat protein